MKVDPFFHSDSTIMLPPNSHTIFFEILRPKPIPLGFSSFVLSKKPNSLNNFFKSFFLIPTPVSLTDIYIIPWDKS